MAGFDDELTESAQAVGRRSGLDAVGVATAEVFAGTRVDLQQRKADGLHGGMKFTYKNPVRSTNPFAALAGARALVVGAVSYRRSDPERPPGPTGRVARYAWGDRYAPLRAGLGAIAEELRGRGWRALVFADDNSVVDREAAYRAGIGWYGKNANLLLPDRGSWFVLGSVVTDAPLRGAPAPVADGCGRCTRCIPACPTDAIVAPGVIDARRCLAWLVQAPGSIAPEYRVALGDRVYGCDECQESCPPNQRSDRRAVLPGPEPGDAPWVSLLEWLRLTDAELMARHGRWYIADRHPRHLRRNALVALGNVGDPEAGEVVAAVSDALLHDDALVRGHAVWAAGRLGLTGLLGELRHTEGDPGVRAEIALVDSGAVPVRSRDAHGGGHAAYNA